MRIILIVLLNLLNLVFIQYLFAFNNLIDIKVNGFDNLFTVTNLDKVSLELNIDKTFPYLNKKGDYWLAIYNGESWVYFDYSNKQWKNIGNELSNIKPSYQGKIIPLNSFTISTTLPVGMLDIYFAVDPIPDGKLNFNQLFFDKISLLSEESVGIIRGQVVDKDGNPLSGVYITIWPSTYIGSKSNKYGYYQLYIPKSLLLNKNDQLFFSYASSVNNLGNYNLIMISDQYFQMESIPIPPPTTPVPPDIIINKGTDVLDQLLKNPEAITKRLSKICDDLEEEPSLEEILKHLLKDLIDQTEKFLEKLVELNKISICPEEWLTEPGSIQEFIIDFSWINSEKTPLENIVENITIPYLEVLKRYLSLPVINFSSKVSLAIKYYIVMCEIKDASVAEIIGDNKRYFYSYEDLVIFFPKVMAKNIGNTQLDCYLLFNSNNLELGLEVNIDLANDSISISCQMPSNEPDLTAYFVQASIKVCDEGLDCGCILLPEVIFPPALY